MHEFESRIWKRRSVLPEELPEPPPTSPEVTGDADVRSADLFILCGLPGSGKSWFRESLALRDRRVRVFSGDEIGRAACERSFGQNSNPNRVILDRCNTTKQDRKDFLSLASTWAKHPVAVYFDVPAEICAQRAMRRSDHPSLPQGSRVHTAISHHSKGQTAPVLSEGFKAVVRVTSFHASLELAARCAPPVPLFKFPRTAHLINLGAATRDDLSMSLDSVELSGDSNSNCTVIVTEKVDGANMGFSCASDGRIIMQNRSHYVTHESHTQFRRLEGYVQRHTPMLHRVLARDEKYPERFILFGEWLAATHSIPYDALPSLFVAFDMYDRATETWMDRKGLEALLEGTGIPMVPLLATFSKIPTHQELLNLVHRKSNFAEHASEGKHSSAISWNCMVECLARIFGLCT